MKFEYGEDEPLCSSCVCSFVVMKQKLKGSSYENINVKKLGAILIYAIYCGQRDKPQQLSGLFAAVTSITAVIKLATDYLLRLGPKTAAIVCFFSYFFSYLLMCIYNNRSK